jgi:hypothetical protein
MESELVTVRRITITKAEIVHKTTKIMGPDSTKAVAQPSIILKISRMVTTPIMPWLYFRMLCPGPRLF